MSNNPPNGNGKKDPWLDRAEGEVPPWIDPNYTPGKPLAADLRKNPVTKKEIESAVRFRDEVLSRKGSHAMQFASADEKFYMNALRHARASEVNFRAFQAEIEAHPDHPDVEKWKSLAVVHRLWLGRSLMQMGEFDMARSAVASIESAEADQLRTEIAYWEAAIERDDEEQCDCPPQVLTHETTGETPLQLPKVTPMGKSFSKKHNKVVNVYVCNQCGDPNAHGNHPPELAKLDELRRNADHAMRAKGTKPHQISAAVLARDVVHLNPSSKVWNQ